MERGLFTLGHTRKNVSAILSVLTIARDFPSFAVNGTSHASCSVEDNFHVSYGLVVSGTIIPPKITEFEVYVCEFIELCS